MQDEGFDAAATAKAKAKLARFVLTVEFDFTFAFALPLIWILSNYLHSANIKRFLADRSQDLWMLTLAVLVFCFIFGYLRRRRRVNCEIADLTPMHKRHQAHGRTQSTGNLELVLFLRM